VRKSAISLAVALLVLAPLPGDARAQGAVAPKLKEQISIQEGIYRSRGEEVPEGYVIGRSLLAYSTTLSEEFRRSLAELGPQDRWLDIGAGEGRAILDYYTERYDSMNPEGRERRGKKAKSVAISIEDRRTAQWHETAARLEADKIRYAFGRRLREYAPGELGKFKLISDVIGGFSYSFDLSVFVEKTLSVLEVGGNFYTLLQDVKAEDGSNKPHYPGSPYLTEITRPDGSEVRVCTWLKSISCVQVSCQLRTGWKPPIEVYRIQKTCDQVSVPALAAAHYEAGTPPERRYVLKTPAPLAAGAAR
jgi:hypothetical protein